MFTLSRPISRFQSTPSVRRATDDDLQMRQDTEISIHALREEGDKQIQDLHTADSISIHALREEGD